MTLKFENNFAFDWKETKELGCSNIQLISYFVQCSICSIDYFIYFTFHSYKPEKQPWHSFHHLIFYFKMHKHTNV